jgi:hypothetical protein
MHFGSICKYLVLRFATTRHSCDEVKLSSFTAMRVVARPLKVGRSCGVLEE